MKNKTFIVSMIIILSLLVIGLTLFMVNAINGSFKMFPFSFQYKTSNELIVDENYLNEFEYVQIDTKTSEVSVIEGEEEIIRVKIYGDKDYTKIDTNNQTLKISSEGKKCFGICFNRTISKIEVYLPKEFNKKIQIDNDYGDIEVGHFINADININEDCGDVFVQTGKVITIQNQYGDIKIDKAVEVDVQASAGDIKIGEVETIVADNNYGDVSIKNVLGYMNITVDCGEVKIDQIDLKKNSSIVNRFGDIKINSTNEIYIDAKTDLGDNEIKHNYPKADVTLNIKNDCGDIEVNN